MFPLCQTSDGLGRLAEQYPASRVSFDLPRRVAEQWTIINYGSYLSSSNLILVNFQLSPKGGFVRVYKLPLYNFLSPIRALENDFMINRQMNQCYCKHYMQLNLCEMIKSIMKSTIQPYSIYLTKDEIHYVMPV